jgi:hypothetical protein
VRSTPAPDIRCRKRRTCEGLPRDDAVETKCFSGEISGNVDGIRDYERPTSTYEPILALAREIVREAFPRVPADTRADDLNSWSGASAAWSRSARDRIARRLVTKSRSAPAGLSSSLERSEIRRQSFGFGFIQSRCRHVAKEMADVVLRRLQFGHALARRRLFRR